MENFMLDKLGVQGPQSCYCRSSECSAFLLKWSVRRDESFSN